MRNSLKLGATVGLVTATLMAGQAISQTYNPYSPIPDSRPYDSIKRELSYARQRADGRYSENGRYNSSYAQSAFDAMKRAMTYRDKGDMKNACRYATLAVNMLNRAGFDRSLEIVSAYAETQQEFCSAVDA